jgi:transcriptional regulator with XRE-family HTH domain
VSSFLNGVHHFLEATVPLRPDRFRALRDAKGLSQKGLADLSKVGQSTITKLERGGAPNLGADVLERIALALDATTDYFYGRGFEETNAEVAAAHMSFDIFAKDPNLSNEYRERCRRVLSHRDAPKTARGWRSFAEMLDLAVEPTPPTSSRRPKLALIPERRSKSKA